MKQFKTEKIFNVALLGHANSGKSSVAESIIYLSGASERLGKATDKSLITDFDSEERKRGVSVSTAVYPVVWNDSKINLIDAPGLFDFAGGVREALTAAENAIIVLSGKSGLTVGAEQCFELARNEKKSTSFFISKLDSAHEQFYGIISVLAGHYGAVICPVFVPVCGSDHSVKSYVDLITSKGYVFDGVNAKEVSAEFDDNVKLMRTMMIEAVASTDEALMDKYFAGEELTESEILEGLKKGIVGGEICPVFCGIGQTGAGIKNMMDVIIKICPTAADIMQKCEINGEEKEIKADVSGKTAAVVFKTIADPFVGKLSYFKVVSGALKADSKLVNTRTGSEERLSKIAYIKAGIQEDTSEICAGDIGCASKLGNVLTGDTLCAAGADITVKTLPFPSPSLNMAVYPRKKGDEEKIASGLYRLCEEDPTVSYTVDKETKESILSGLGEQHLDVIISKLKSKFGVEVDLRTPKVAYRETIRKSVKAQGRHKKQSGGHGQFGDVWIEFMPSDSDGLVFEENVFGGSVPKSFFPAVEKGLQESMKKGVLAGFPMVGVKAVLYDGSYHPVDSSEMSFKMAAALAFKEGIPKACPVILEPIGSLMVTTPDDNLGDVIGDINKRRGRVIGMNPIVGHKQEIIAEVPMSEMGSFSTSMRSLTQGRATFTLTFARYEDAPPMISAKIIEANKGE